MGEIASEFQTKKDISWISTLGKSLGQHQRSNRTTSPTTVAEDSASFSWNAHWEGKIRTLIWGFSDESYTSPKFEPVAIRKRNWQK